MSLMKILSLDTTTNYYNKEVTVTKKKTKHLFKIVKSIYNSKKKYKNLNLQSKADIINIYFTNFYYLNVILNNVTKK